MPRATPSTAAIAVRPSVKPAPRSSSGHCERTAAKSNGGIATSVRQVARGSAQPALGHRVEFARGLGRGDDLVDLQAQLVLALADADEIRRILEHELVLGAQLRVARHHV